MRFFGVDPILEAKAAPKERERITNLIADMLPLSARVDGIMTDTTSKLVKPDLGHIQSPTLIISAQDDLYHTLPGARFAAEHIPDAELKIFKTGGHLLILHGDDVPEAISAFLDKDASDADMCPGKSASGNLSDFMVAH